MGLFDGYDNSRGSSAEVAELLGLPVILVMNARSTAYTVAAVLYGFKHFRPEVRIAGAVFNFVGTEAHYAYLKQACRDAGVEALGYLPRCEEIEIPSRHLGLNIGSDFCFEAFADRIAAQVEATVDIDRLLAITDTAFTTKQEEMPAHQGAPLRISVGRDEAFNFMYPENIRALEQYGEITYFSPLRDKALPPSDFVYLPGGYPEFYLEQLSGNEEMRRSVAAYCEGNGLLLAECGGMMYLCESIRDEEGKEYPMCGFLPQTASMEGMKLRLGYRKIVINGKEYRGHEFHYSRILPGETPLGTIGKAYNAKGLSVETPVYRKGRVTAGYTHFYRTGAGHSLLEIAQESEGCNEQDR